MKVILKSEVDNLGLPGDVVDVADGYGRNFLIPRGLAILASKGAMKEAEALTRARKAKEAKTLGSAQSAADVLEARVLRIPANVDDRGRLYGSVSAVDVARVLKERGHEIPRRRIELKGTIKQIGTYEVPVRVHPQVTATVQVEVVDTEGKVTLEGVEAAERELETDLEALTEQALEAAEEYEEQLEQEAVEEAGDAADAGSEEAGAAAEAGAETAAAGPETATPADEEPAQQG
jgi:large subunit ribosomal protein L9